ncbi:MAG: hypothetical protein R6V23_11925 [Bacteroidales bacterium]
MRQQLLAILFILIALVVKSQNLTNLHSKSFTVYSDSIIIDTLSIVPGSEIITLGNRVLSDSLYHVEYAQSILYLNPEILTSANQLSITYRVFPIDLSASYYHRKKSDVEIIGPILARPETGQSNFQQTFFTDNQIDKRGSISRGITIGNNQDAVISSNLNLQLAGKIGKNMNLLAAISDENIPIQPEGNSQQIQEFDKVFIQLYNEKFKLIAGDFEITSPTGYYMKLNKKAQGGLFNTKIAGRNNHSNILESTVSAAVSKGKFCRKTFRGQEGNQGPYKLTGCENELYIIVLAGTEKVFIDGKLQSRGKENDYTIDYNTGEITFTANKPITKDSRIAIEFEYSERSYARFLVYTKNTLKTENGSFWLNIYSEQDSKNQPLNQDLTDEQKQLLAESGDDIQNAFVPNVDSVDFRNDYVLYKKTDTTINGIVYEIYKYSTNPEKAIYQVGFSYTGENNGNYIQTRSSANGKVFTWIAPVNGEPQGSYEPVRLLISPKKQQLVNVGGEYHINHTTSTFFELALSNQDINTFSSKDASDNVGYALKFNVEKSILNADTLKNKLTTNITYQLINQNFTALERYRPVEFERDWNIQAPFLNNENYIDLMLNYKHKKTFYGQYQVAVLNSQNDYEGLRNVFNTSLQKYGFTFHLNSSLLNTETKNNKTQFIRYLTGISKSFQKIKFGIENELEHNEWNDLKTDSLLNNSFNFSSYRIYIQNSDSTVNQFTASYLLRNDLLPKNNEFNQATQSEDFNLGFGLLKNPASVLKTNFTYRKLKILDSALTKNNEENNITGRVSYNFRLFKGAITSSIFYEAGSGLEPKKEYSYLKVSAGQGVYTWTDYNQNAIAELDEFEIAQFQDEANYIRIYTPGSEYIKTYKNEYNQVLNLRPEAIWKNKSGIKKVLSKFSNSLALLINQKSTNHDFSQSLNPFYFNDGDTALINLNQNFRNTFSFKRSDPKFGADYIFQQNQNKTLLTNGFDERKRVQNGLRIRWNFISDFTLQEFFNVGSKEYRSEFFSTKNYEIDIISNEFKIQYQPGFQTKIELNYRFSNKQNNLSVEKSESHTIGTELNYTFTKKGNIILQGNFINIDYNANSNTSLAYEMLEGLKPGNNATWNITLQRKLAGYLELNLLYNGRISEDVRAIHTGSIQLRAFF